MKLTFFKGVVLGVTTCFVMLTGASALAGTGIGDVFNLAQDNSVDATSTLIGSTTLVLSGGFWGMDPGTTIFADRPLNVDQWQVAVTNNSTVDQFQVFVWCADVTP